MGMVGGGEGAFIGAIHRIAAQMDGQIELVCGAFSSQPQRSKRSGEQLYLAPERCYESYQAMFMAESELDESLRMDFVAIVTPNYLHFPIAKMAIEHGFHLICDKPATLSLSEAQSLKTLLDQSSSLYALTHTYTGYPMVKEARARISNGELGTIQKIVVEYSQGWLSKPQDTNNKQAEWRLDPKRAGVSCCMGDIGVHASNLAEYISGSHIKEVCSLLESTVADRQLDDDGTVALRFDNKAHGLLIASQISVGEENNLRIRVYGSDASLDWSQQEPNTLWLKYQDKSSRMLRTGVGDLAPQTMENCRTPSGHPEGYLEAFANIYRHFSEQIRQHEGLVSTSPLTYIESQGIEDAIRGMAFIETVVSASQSEKKWHPLHT